MNKEHFEMAYQWSLKPVTDVSFAVFSSDIWKRFQEYIGDNKTIIDLGCGAGVFLYNILQVAGKYNNCSVLGYDYSGEAIRFAKQLCPNCKFKVGDVLSVDFNDNYFDIVTSSMTIEHVDDDAFLNEVARIIKPKGVLFLTTVMKKSGAWYYLKNKNGESVLELSHLREYNSPDEIVAKLNRHGFRVILLKTPRIKFSILDFILIRLAKILKNRFFSEIAAKNAVVKLRKMSRIPIPGYYAIEAIATKE